MMGMIIASSAVHRVNLEANGHEISRAAGNGIPLCEKDAFNIQNLLRKSIKVLQKEGRPDIVPGVMVWYHSVRALDIPEMTYMGRDMWRELSRGFDIASQQYEFLKDAGLLSVVDKENEDKLDFNFIPEGLKPLNNNLW